MSRITQRKKRMSTWRKYPSHLLLPPQSKLSPLEKASYIYCFDSFPKILAILQAGRDDHIISEISIVEVILNALDIRLILTTVIATAERFSQHSCYREDKQEDAINIPLSGPEAVAQCIHLLMLAGDGGFVVPTVSRTIA